MATTTERLGIVETKVENLNEKLDDLKVDVKDLHDCLDKTRDIIETKLEIMYQASCTQHAEMAKKISTIERFKDKWMYTFAGGMIVLSWASAHADSIIAILK
jgi:flagellar capping protein FliD